MLKLDNNGYIRHLIRTYTSDRSKYTHDLCGVFKGLLWSFCTIMIIIICSTLITSMLFGWTVPLVAYGFSSEVLAEPFFKFSLGMIAAVILLVCVIFLDLKIEDKRRTRQWLIDSGRLEVQPSIFAVWYDGFKNKYCPRVEFVDKSEDT